VLAGRSWTIISVDWARRVVQVEPTEAPGVARWTGSGQPLGAVVARGVREVLVGTDPPGVVLSERAKGKLGGLRACHPWAAPETPSLVIDDRGRAGWWPFAGWRANLSRARLAASARKDPTAVDDLTIAVDSSVGLNDLRGALEMVGGLPTAL